MGKAHILCVIAAISIATPARADWSKVATSTSNSDWYMDADRIKASGKYVEAWVKIDSSRDRTVKGSEAKQLLSFDCGSDKYRTLSLTIYDTYGKVIDSSTQTDYGYGIGYKPVIPDTVMETVEKVACALGAPAE